MIKEIKNNHLYWDGCDTVELAENYGTPLYVISQTAIENECRALQKDFIKKYDNVHVAYASKAFNNLAMLKIIEKEGLGIDVVSGGELYTAIQAQFPAEHIEFNGNNKSDEELAIAIDYGVGRIIVDGSQELDRIGEICRKKEKKANILFRITPEVDVATHQFISTGQKDSKFGLPLDEEFLFPILQQAITMPEVDFYGIHFHIGSQLFDNTTHLKAAKVALELAVRIKEKFDYEIKELNYGGGFGVRYTQDDQRQSYAYFLDPLMALTEDFCEKNGLKRPAIAIEPGRSIVAEAGITLHTIGSIKTLPHIRKYAAIDGGMTDNVRPGLYQAIYTGMVANKADQPLEETVTISGKACESTDILMKDLQVPLIASGDIFTTFTTGAYGYAMANNYNKLAIPAVVLVNKGQADIIVKRQTYAQIIQNERIPDSLK
ncbi:diaminopimelate decarboxylase [Tetragenococcus koreensis]|uniref:Diaminopimelate decarboxylase n=1 Tax=Tetragenococcus koreensis TaxID=290335 RepID=A0AAN4UCV4_9ENTE|nr:diaminopimelate decarboxylase [Tetragenococcus koreensis]MDN6641024.1 diaminopimelate decarboxylase [Tetragenococcus sp.]AYW45642.1 diaminopimelate decarboxylase [Tetragenococcus koreensis]MCF1586271.1 diaminopimelate decarboxylase [Tetragenococcus koreensis]MCF1614827.1 diaminopimelate decarboxylase [Tetragenococcus koreensis]MCF1617612.1 diaminopimelate decarboxylase [Tetragenococcus koreensis]